MPAPRSEIILCADDFGMSKGISEAILALAEAKRISAASALVTAPAWPQYAPMIARLRDRIAVGLHVNLSFARPLGAMPRLAPNGEFTGAPSVIRHSMAGRIDRGEIAAEVERQLDRFLARTGFAPDFVDGHHHLHVLPGIRDAVLGVLAQRFPDRALLIRDPSDRSLSILRRGSAAVKAVAVALFASGYANLVAARGFICNQGFAGFSRFGAIPFDREFETYFIDAGPRHLVMCHPGFRDDDDDLGDEVRERRCEEYEVLSRRPNLPDRIWRPERRHDATGAVAWPALR